MQTVYSGQSNILNLPLAAKASGGPIVSGTVNFYLIANGGDEAGKWYRGSDQTWQATAAIAGAATHKDDGHWQLSLPSGVWTKDVGYLLYAKESGDLHITVETHIECKSPAEKVLATWFLGIAQDKDGEDGTQELLDVDDGSTPVIEVVMDTATPYRTVTIL